jgi:hypothetical protein
VSASFDNAPRRSRYTSRPVATRPGERQGAAELLAALAGWDPVLLRRAAVGYADDGYPGVSLLLEAVACAEDEGV